MVFSRNLARSFLIEELCSETGARKDNIYKVSLAGNAIMRHIFPGISPENISFSPYVPVVKRSLRLRAEDSGIQINRRSIIYLLPDLGSYVGSDITGVLNVLNLENEDKIRLSPGYAGWDLSEQGKLISMLKENEVGIFLTEAYLLMPEKSVSGVYGLVR